MKRVRFPDDRCRHHVFVSDDDDSSQKQASGAKVKADSEPTYKIKPQTGRDQRGHKPRT